MACCSSAWRWGCLSIRDAGQFSRLYQRHFPHGFLRMLANDRDRLSGGNVEAWTPGFLSQDSVEVLLNDLFSPRQSIVPAPLIDYGAVPATEGWSTSMHCVRCWVDPMLDSGKFFLRRVIGLPPICTDTSDTVFLGNTGNSGNYRNCSLSSDSLVTHSKLGYYRGSVVFIGTCR